MNEQEAKKRIDELVKLLNYHSQLYYVEDRNEITDYEYDMLQQELKGLEEQFPQFIRSDSPTQRVGGKAISIFEKVTHRVQMGSLQDVFSFEQVRSFIETVQQAVDKPQFVVEPKIDGLSVSLDHSFCCRPSPSRLTPKISSTITPPTVSIYQGALAI